MSLIKEIFSIRTVILLVSLLAFAMFIRSLFKVYDGNKKLIKHQGIVSNKHFVEYKVHHADEPESTERMLTIELLNDAAQYTVSADVDWINNSIDTGDTIQLFTMGNMSSSGELVYMGSGFSTTNSPYKVFHLVSNKDNNVLVNFKLNQKKLQKSVWLLFVMALIFFGWYISLRLKIKSPFLINSFD